MSMFEQTWAQPAVTSQTQLYQQQNCPAEPRLTWSAKAVILQTSEHENKSLLLKPSEFFFLFISLFSPQYFKYNLYNVAVC